MNAVVKDVLKNTKRLIVAVIGFTVLLLGIALIVLPGPAFIVIPVGLGILATEFIWARNMLNKVKDRIKNNKIRRGQQ